jgi:WD40 repeat protein
VSDLAFSPSGKHYAAATHNLRFWAAEKREIASFRRATGTSGDKIRFSPDGKQLAVGGASDVSLWALSSRVAGKEVK